MLSRSVAAFVLFAVTLLGFAQERAARADSAGPAPVERGRYLATDAGQCADCHGPGLRGSPLPFPVPPTPDFTKRAPRIAGLPNLTTAQAAHFLQTGILPSGRPARHPMPGYRFNRADAAALAAYLESI